MKICIVSQYYNPDVFLINEITPELVKLGHEVTVLTGLPDYMTGKIPSEYKWFRRRCECISGVEVFRVPTLARRKGVICRIANYLSFMISSSFFSIFWRKKFDIIMTYQMSPITQVTAGKVLSRRLEVPHLIYCMDLWPASVNAWNFNEKSIVYKVAHAFSKWAYQDVERIAVSSRPFEEYLVNANNVDKGRIMYLPQHSSSMVLPEEKADCEEVNLIFAGNIGSVQNIECLIRSVAKIKTQKAFFIHIYGDGTSLEKCKKLTKELGLDTLIKFYGRIPKEELPKIYSKMDALLLTLASARTAGAIATTVPSKFQNYLSTGKPVIASIDGGAAEIIKETGCGLVSAADDEEGFARNLQEFIENKNKYIEAGIRGKKYFEENYRKEVFIKRLNKILLNM